MTAKRKNNRPFFDRLETRQHMAVDFTATTVVPKGAYGAGDLFDCDIKLTNKGSSTDLPSFVSVVLSKDKKLGNADDIAFGGNVFLGAKAGKTATMSFQAAIQDKWAAGDYYVITNADPYGSNYDDSNKKNNVTISAKKDIRIVTEKLSDGAVVKGTPKNDVITIQGNFANEVITVNGHSYLYEVAGNLKPVSIQAGKGDDKISCDANCNLPHILSGNAGNDTIVGGNYNDEIWGDAGQDRIYAGDGADVIHGGSSNDIIDGGKGVDHIYAEGGKDKAKKDPNDIMTGVESQY